jgi:proton-coupled amino acid transporter
MIGIFFTFAMVMFFFYFMASQLSENGPRPEVVMINTKNTDLLLWLGACAYAYEGINIVLPTYESAKDKDSMPKLLIGITAMNTLMYIAFGILTYYAFGSDTQSLASLNLPRQSFEGKAIPVTSIIIGLMSFPLQAFVIYQTYEPKITWSSNYHVRKWQKNAVRLGVLLFTITVTWLGGNQLQNFLALVGGFCCGSLALIFPSILHLKICKPTGIDLVCDYFILVSGCVILLLSTEQAFADWQ